MDANNELFTENGEREKSAAQTPEHRCNNLTYSQLNQYNISINENDIAYGKCSIDIISKDTLSQENITLPCLNGHFYNTPVSKSIVSQWDLVCNKKDLVPSAQTFYILGQLLSGIISPYFIERFGRKPTRWFCNVIIVLVNLVCAYSPVYSLFAIMRFITGILVDIHLLTSMTAMSEMYSKEKRAMMSSIYSFIWCSLAFFPGWTAYFLKDNSWNKFVLLNAALSGYFIVEFFFLEESLRWLFANGKLKQAEKVIKTATKQNNIDFDSVWRIVCKDTSSSEVNEIENNWECRNIDRKVHPEDSTDENEQEELKRNTSKFVKLLIIFKTPYLRKITIAVSISWICDITTFTSLLLLPETFGGNIYLNFISLTLTEAVATGMYMLVVKRYGHKSSMISAKLFAAIFVFSSSLLKVFAENNQTNDIIFFVLFVVSNIGVSATYCANYMYTPELYPTQIRSIGMGIPSSVARIFSLCAPYFQILANDLPWAPGVVFGTAFIISAIFVFYFLPETYNMVLPQTVEDLKIQNSESNLKKTKIHTIS